MKRLNGSVNEALKGSYFAEHERQRWIGNCALLTAVLGVDADEPAEVGKVLSFRWHFARRLELAPQRVAVR